MPRLVSLNARLSADAAQSEEIEVILIRITHEDIDEPVRLSTDPTARLSDDPLRYGTVSTWLNEAEEENSYFFAFISAQMPGDDEDTPATAALTFDNVDAGLVDVVRSTITRATVDLAVVMASTPDLVELEYLGLKIMEASWDAGSVSLTISSEPITNEPYPAGRMTRNSFPALHS